MLRVRCEVSVTVWLWGKDLSPMCRKSECTCTFLLCSLKNDQLLHAGMAPAGCFDTYFFNSFHKLIKANCTAPFSVRGVISTSSG